MGRIATPTAFLDAQPRSEEAVEPVLQLTAFTTSEFSFLSPMMTRRAWVEGERLDPRVAERLTRSVGIPPGLIVYGDWSRMVAVAPTVRRVRSVGVYESGRDSILVGRVFDLPLVVLAGVDPQAQALLEEARERGHDWLWILLVGRPRTTHGAIEDGCIVAAHEVELTA